MKNISQTMRHTNHTHIYTEKCVETTKASQKKHAKIPAWNVGEANHPNWKTIGTIYRTIYRTFSLQTEMEYNNKWKHQPKSQYKRIDCNKLLMKASHGSTQWPPKVSSCNPQHIEYALSYLVAVVVLVAHFWLFLSISQCHFYTARSDVYYLFCGYFCGIVGWTLCMNVMFLRYIFRQFFNFFFIYVNMVHCSPGMSTNSLKSFKTRISFFFILLNTKIGETFSKCCVIEIGCLKMAVWHFSIWQV